MTCTRTNFIIENGTIITDVVSCLKKEFVTNFQLKTTTIVNDKTTKLIKKKKIEVSFIEIVFEQSFNIKY